MQIYHTSPEKIKNIHKHGIAGDCLFFSDKVYVMSSCETMTYTLEIEEDTLIKAKNPSDIEIIEDIADYFEVDKETAESILDGSESEWSFNCDADKAWWLQGKRGECAKKMGFQGCIDTDEQGRVYIIPMTGRESELNQDLS